MSMRPPYELCSAFAATAAQVNKPGAPNQVLRRRCSVRPKIGRVSESFSTLAVQPDQRMDFWRDMVRRYFVPLGIQPLTENVFDGSARLRAIGELSTVRVRAHSMLATRARKHIEHAAGDEYFLGVHLRGVARAEQDGRVATLNPGDFVLFDSARPYQIAFRGAPTFDHLIVRVPREQLDARVMHLDRLTAQTVKARSAAGRVATPALRTLASLDRPDHFVDPVLDLVAAALTETAGSKTSRSSRRQGAISTVKRYTLAHLSDTNLSPQTAAQACCISPRQLHRLFAHETTTFRAFVKEARLQRIQRDLADPALTNLSIADIGLRHGYANPPVLSRAFSGRYGAAPRTFRHSQLNLAHRSNVQERPPV